MSQRSHKFVTSRSSRVSGNYMASRAPLGVAPPNLPAQQTSAVIDLTNDDEPRPRPRPKAKAKEPVPAPRQPAEMIDLTGDISSRSPSPPRSRPAAARSARKEPVPRVRSPLVRSPLPPLSRDSSPDERAHSPLPPLTRDSSPEEQGRRVRERVSAVKQASSPHIKISPQSLQNQREQDQREETLSSRRQTSRQKSRPSTPELSEEDDDEDEGAPLPGSFQPFPGSPSKQPSSRGHRRSQKSTDFSVGSSSPLITRLKQRRNSKQVNGTPKARSQSPREVVSRRSASSEHASPKEPLTQEELETSLEGFESRLNDDHACGMRWLLQDVRETVADRRSAFFKAPFVETGRNSPWASNPRKQVQSEPSSGDATHIDKLDSFVMAKSRLTKTRSQLIGGLINTDLPRVPKYYSHTNVKRNILTADDEKLKFIPFLGDYLGQGTAKKQEGHKRLLKELEEAYSATRISSSRETERASSLGSHLDTWLKELKVACNKQDLTQYILEDDDSCAELRLKPRDRKALLSSFGESLPPNVHEAAELFSEAFHNVFSIPLHYVILSGERLREMTEAAGKPVSKTPEKPSNTPADRLGTYTTLTCMICGAVDCPTHGDYQQEEIKRSEDEDSDDSGATEKKDVECVYFRQPLALEYDAMIRRYEIRRSTKTAEVDPGVTIKHKTPCSDACYTLIDYSDREYEWHQDEIDILPQMLLSLTNKDRRSCSIAFALDRPCWQVHSEIAAYESEHPYVPRAIPESTIRAKAPNWYDNKKRVLKGDWQDLTTAHLHQERAQANPCGHEGPCTNICPCFQANLLCESFCGCPDDCPRKFTGCACVESAIACCVSDNCICIQMNRECGPQCGTCGANDRINPANRYEDELFKKGCQNIVLQRGVSKKLVMGESQLVGFGLYVVEPVQKGDYLSEYAGEVISSAEAERRGIIYDRKFLSFLFDLNGDWVIDAARFGNKTRFINHADNEKNCEAKIVLVNGEHRIKFVALRDINAGEELLFNYGKKFAEKHGLSAKLPKAASEGGKKGVLVGQEALDALDGMDSRKRDTRGKMSAIRGGRGKGKVKMRKTAVVPDPVEAMEVDEDPTEEELYGAQAEEEVEESDEDEDVRESRRRRRITRPARYTR
ncbi:hypothetical protein N431DRAFT_351183 [Stipitochalara longipes BDJ]|nr:hypothetical protein N431DRAFT_351183 [Stipitochalara longipes BDJ]